MLIYFAGPLFSEAEKRFNFALTGRLEVAGFGEERRQAIFELDKRKIFEADAFLFVLDGRVPDEGACVELGLAYAHRELSGSNKLLVGLHTDVRSAFMGSRLNPMVGVPLDHLVEDEGALLRTLEKHRSSTACCDGVGR